ncbi:MAG: exo-alpha-sialidase, partial [Actinobacteria bacterium]|nr:exo-alpha-sialidase [Actinomycetota bacterium]
MRRLATALAAALTLAAAAAAGPAELVVAWGNGLRDQIDCSDGPDVVNADAGDLVGERCETVLRRIAVDTSTTPGAQQGTIAEPHVVADGTTVVAAYQMSRFESGGAAAIGVAVSRDGGRRWRTRALPTGAGSTDRVSDPVVAWDAKHRVWLVATLSGRPGLASAIRVSRSSDLLRWEAVTVARSPVFRFDKEWIACDNGPGSPYRGRCHIAYTDTIARTIVARTSDDGGATWRSPVVVGPPADGQVGAVPVTTPDGRLVISWLRGLRTQV